MADTSPQIPRTTRVTRGMTTDASRKAVLNTTELLEQIILCLPAKTIFGMQRTCKQFRDVIQDSTPIQQTIFLKPSVQPQMWKMSSDSRELEWAVTPEVWRQGMKFVKCTEDEQKAVKSDGPRVLPVKMNPLFQEAGVNVMGSMSLMKSYLDTPETSFDLSLGGTPIFDIQSWRRMLVSDPPMEHVELTLLFWHIKGQKTREETVVAVPYDDKKLLTLGSLVDAAMDTERRLYYADGDHIFTTAEHLIHLEEKKLGNPAKFGLNPAVRIFLKGVITPTDQEWKAVEQSAD